MLKNDDKLEVEFVRFELWFETAETCAVNATAKAAQNPQKYGRQPRTVKTDLDGSGSAMLELLLRALDSSIP
jgi:hypothetical protein